MVTILPRRLTMPDDLRRRIPHRSQRPQPDHLLDPGGIQRAKRVAHEKGRQQDGLAGL